MTNEFRESIFMQNGVVYLQLAVTDDEVREWLRRWEEEQQVEMAKRALKVGVTALGSAFVSTTSELIKQTLERWRAEVENALSQSRDLIVRTISEKLGQQVTEPVQKHIEQAARTASDRIHEHLKNVEQRLDPSNPQSWLHTVQKIVDEVRKEFDAEREGSYLWRVRSTLMEFYNSNGHASRCISDTIKQALTPLNNLLESIKQSVEEIKVRVGGVKTEKGKAFEEESVRQLLERIVATTGDRCEHVGVDNRAGDWLIHVCYGGIGNRQEVGKIVIEAKDTNRRKTEVEDDLDSALKTRNANAGILLFARPDQNPYNLNFTALDPSCKKMVCVWDEEGLSLNFAYQLARLCLIENHLRAMATTEIDWESLHRSIQSIRDEVEGMEELVNKARLAKERAEEAEMMGRDLKRRLIQRVQELDSHLQRYGSVA